MQNPGFLQVARPVMEDKDCAVRALANATGMPYAEAHQLFHDAGRRPNKGTSWSALTSVYNRFGMLGYTNSTLGAFLESSSKGTYICRTPGHVFAVRDGVVMDTGMSKLTSRVRHFWMMDKHLSIAEYVAEEVLVTPNRGYRPLAFNIHALMNRINSVQVANDQG